MIQAIPMPDYPDFVELVKARGIDYRKQALDKLRYLQHQGDPEATHSGADEVLCELLNAIGYEDVVAAWQTVPKWYA